MNFYLFLHYATGTGFCLMMVLLVLFALTDPPPRPPRPDEPKMNPILLALMVLVPAMLTAWGLKGGGHFVPNGHGDFDTPGHYFVQRLLTSELNPLNYIRGTLVTFRLDPHPWYYYALWWVPTACFFGWLFKIMWEDRA